MKNIIKECTEYPDAWYHYIAMFGVFGICVVSFIFMVFKGAGAI